MKSYFNNLNIWLYYLYRSAHSLSITIVRFLLSCNVPYLLGHKSHIICIAMECRCVVKPYKVGRYTLQRCVGTHFKVCSYTLQPV